MNTELNKRNGASMPKSTINKIPTMLIIIAGYFTDKFSTLFTNYLLLNLKSNIEIINVMNEMNSIVSLSTPRVLLIGVAPKKKNAVKIIRKIATVIL